MPTNQDDQSNEPKPFIVGSPYSHGYPVHREDEQGDKDEAIEKILRFNCSPSCDGNGSYVEDDGYGNPEQAQCQWCFEFGMPAREAMDTYCKQQVEKAVRGEKVKGLNFAEKFVLPLFEKRRDKQRVEQLFADARLSVKEDHEVTRNQEKELNDE